MTKKIVLAIVVLGLLVLAVPAQAEDQKFTVSGELRTRWENLNNYTDFDDDAQDRFDFWPYRARINVAGRLTNNVSVRMDLQSFGAWGNQSPILTNTTMGPGPIWQDVDGTASYPGLRNSDTFLYQAYVALDKIWDSPINVTLGRQEFNLGTGLILGNEEFYNGTVFDGLKGVWDAEKFDLTAFYFNANERNDPAGYLYQFEGPGTEDQRVWGFVGSLGLLERLKTKLDVYVIDARDFSEDMNNMHFWTYGAHWWRSVKTKADVEEFPLCWNVEVAMQKGEGRVPGDPLAIPPYPGYDIDTAGMVIDLSAGYNLATGSMLHKFYLGAIRQSGDKDQTDTDMEGWIALFPSYHGRFGNADYFGPNFGQFDSGIQALKIGYMLDVKEGKHKAGATYWMFQPAEDSIDTGLGKVDIEDFGSEIDLWYKYMYTDNVGMGVNISQLMPDDGLTGGAGAPDDSVTRIYGMVRVLFP